MKGYVLELNTLKKKTDLNHRYRFILYWHLQWIGEVNVTVFGLLISLILTCESRGMEESVSAGGTCSDTVVTGVTSTSVSSWIVSKPALSDRTMVHQDNKTNTVYSM